MTLFKNRKEAGKLLARQLLHYQAQKNTIILALPRGGVPVAYEIAKQLNLPLDVFLVRKLGIPGQEELAFGAIATSDVVVLNPDVIKMSQLSLENIELVKQKELAVLKYREQAYRHNRALPNLTNKTVIVIDDGVATGATMRAAIQALKKFACKKIVLATPLMPGDTYDILRAEVAEIVVCKTPNPFYAIGVWYQNFPQVADEEVCALLDAAQTFGDIDEK